MGLLCRHPAFVNLAQATDQISRVVFACDIQTSQQQSQLAASAFFRVASQKRVCISERKQVFKKRHRLHCPQPIVVCENSVVCVHFGFGEPPSVSSVSVSARQRVSGECQRAERTEADHPDG